MADMTTSMAYFTLDDGEEEVLQPVNRWLRDELDDHPPGNQVAAKNLRINLPNFSINYGKNFSRDFVGDSVTLIKSTGVVSGQQSSHMDFQMGLVSKDSLMVQPEYLSVAGNLRRWHFRFGLAWLMEDSCESEVQHLWSKSSGSIPDRLGELGTRLDSWFSRINRERQMTVRDLRKKLADLADMFPTNERVEDPLGMARLAMEYFQNLFSSRSPTV
ncbi:hypothetical protein V6N12_013307 [Hibiscus sabdariffa]|uniref:BHLH domain-containing protein n=1 Tax=Hibiscus sabdariffa TaxID=183260 RepID=A0ABR2D668_9ROSI